MEINNSRSVVFCNSSEIVYNNQQISKNIHPEIKLFKIELSKYYNIVDILIKNLTPTEVKRAERYRHIKDKNRFIICRGILKYLLAKERHSDISEIQFENNINHKPYLSIDKSLFFNVSHAGNYALIAIGHYELGVDVEFIDTNFHYNEILSNVFNEEEIDQINTAENSRYQFYKFWTRKESIVKAIGKGIDDDITKIPATDGTHALPSSLVCDFKKLSVFSFNLNDDYIGALAIAEDFKEVERLNFYPSPTVDDLKFSFQ